MRSTTPRARLGTAMLACTLALGACGGTGGSTSGDTAGKGADVAQAKAIIAPYVGRPSRFPVDTPLAKRPAGKRIAYMDCGTPICGLFFTLADPAAKALGMRLTRIKTGLAADSVAAAFNTVIEQKYDGVFVPAIAPPLWLRGLDTLKANKIPVVTTGVTGGDPTKIDVMQVSDTNVTQAGKLLAAYVVAQHGAKANVVLYTTPELPFNAVLDKAFTSEMAALCGACKVRTAKIPAATLGNRAPSLITDDLQAHPRTKTAVFAVGEQTGGLQSALKVAGITIESIANSPDPATLQQIKAGQMAAGLGLDLPVIAWTLMDSLARLTTGQAAAPGAKADEPPMQFLTKADLGGDVTKGWTGYPDFPQRFTTLWNAAK